MLILLYIHKIIRFVKYNLSKIIEKIMLSVQLFCLIGEYYNKKTQKSDTNILSIYIQQESKQKQ